MTAPDAPVPLLIYGYTDALPPQMLEGPLEDCGVPEAVRYTVNRLITRAYVENRREQRRIISFKVEVDTRGTRDFNHTLLYIRALTEPIVWETP